MVLVETLPSTKLFVLLDLCNLLMCAHSSLLVQQQTMQVCTGLSIY